MEKKNNGWKIVLLVAGLVAAAATILFLCIRTEQRLYRMLGVIERYLPRRKKNLAFEVEL
ncbi:MAG: hypothetical protein IJN76_01315 [Clostridia bacterium]|nr:hypothetical protein [Clostridia bacterium]